MKLVMKLVLAAAVSFAGALLARADVQDLGEGSLQVTGGAKDAPRILTLKHTDVKAEISGFVAEVRVTQVFANPSEAPIEAVYVFPLPENAAVHEMALTVADRVIKGQIKKREEARQVYEQARAEGRTAALLDQERPNIFTQSVANIPPGHEIRVTLKYIQDLAIDHGVYKFHFPMTIGPRYIPGARTENKSGTGWSHDTAAVPDASRVTPPVVKPGRRSGRDISVEVRLDGGVAVKEIRSASHLISVESSGPAKAVITLDQADSVPNKDFLLAYEPAVRLAGAAVLAHKEGKDGYMTLMVQPGENFPLGLVTPKELLIAIDVSGSMSGLPVETARRTAIKCLENMNPGDTFQIMSFASGNELHFERALANTPANVARGRAVIEGLRGGGGTEMLSALGKALEAGKDPERMRIVLFMTDGFIGNEAQILSYIRAHLNNARIFPLGVGSSPNRYLLEEMAVIGKGSARYVRLDEKPEKLQQIIEQFQERISRPLLTDLAVDWNGLDAKDMTPGFIPDLFSGQPLYLHARYGKAGSAPVTLRGKLHGKPWKLTFGVNLPDKETANDALGPLWARSRITELERLSLRGEDADARERILMLALEHKLLTRYTSFVAVDETPGKAGTRPLLVPVESELPEGTQYEGFFGGAAPAPAGMGGSGAFAGGSLSGPAARGAARYAAPSVMSKIGAYAQAKFSGSASSVNSPALFQNGYYEEEDGAAGAVKEEAGRAKGHAALYPDNPVAQAAHELLTDCRPANLRKFAALQGPSGAFFGPGGKAPAADQALALLALVKAKSALGADADHALGLLWDYLRSVSADGLNARRALVKALKDSKYWSSAAVQKELSALGPQLERLK